MPPPGQNWRWEDYETGESGVMPWTQERDPTDYEIDSYRAREKYRVDNGGLTGWARSYIPDSVEDWWTERNKPNSTFMGDTFKEGYKASGGRPISIPSPLGTNFSIPIPQGLGEFAGSMLNDQTSDINLALNAATLGGYAGLSGLGGMAKGGLQALGKIGGVGQMAQGGIGLGAGSINMADAMSKGNEATWGDYGNAALQLGLGAFGMWGGKGDYDAMAPKPKPPGPITDPSRLIGPGDAGARFSAGPEGIADLAPPTGPVAPERLPRDYYLSQQAGFSPDAPPRGEQFSGGMGSIADPNAPTGGGIEIAGLGQGPDVLGEHTLADPFASAPAQDLQLQPPVSPRGVSAGRPFEQDAGIWQQFRQEPTGQGMDLSAHQLQDPVVPNTTLDGPGTSRPASDFWRTVVAEGQAAPSYRPVSALGVQGPNIPDVAPVVDPTIAGRQAERAQGLRDTHPFVNSLEDWKAEQLEMGASADEVDEAIRQSTELGVDPTKSDDLYDLDNYMSAVEENPDWMPEQEALGHWSKPELMAWHKENYGGVSPAQEATLTAMAGEAKPTNIDAGPATTSMAPAAQTPAPALPTPVAPVRDAASRVAVAPEPKPAAAAPLVRPKVPGKPTPDRVIRIGRGVHDAVRAIFPDKLHVDLFSALGRAKRQMRGERGGIPPNYEGLAQQLGVSVKEAHRIADEYRLKVLKLTKEAPGLGPEGSDTVDIEMPHWGGKPAEMVPAAPTPAPVAAAPVAAPVAAAAPNPAAELNAALAARGAAPIPERGQTPKAALPKSKKARVALVMDELVTRGEAEVRAIADDPARLLATAKAAGIKSATLKKAIQDLYEKVDTSKVSKAPDKSSDRSPRLARFHKEFMEKLKAGIPDAREQGELDNTIVRIYKEMNPGLKVDPKNPRAVRALNLVRAIRVKTESAMKTTRKIFPEITDKLYADAAKIRELSYGKLKMEKEDIINHYLDTGKIELPDPDIDVIDDPHLSKVQAWFKKQGGSDTGALSLPSKAQLQAGWDKAFEAGNQVRMTSMLSGLALPKSLAGNLGAHIAAALEGKTLKPLKVLMNYKAIARDIAIGWKGHANPAMVAGLGKFNLPGRLMGAADFASIASLQRAGLSEKAAKELLLTGSNPVSAWPILGSKMGKLLVPFRTTPFNQFAQGMTRWQKHPDVAAAVMILGYLGGKQTKEPEEIAMMSALAGPYALPFLLAASWSAGGEVLGGISPIPEWGITKTLQNPFAAFTESPGRRWFRPGAGFGEAAKKEKQKEALVRRRAKRKAEREAAYD